MTKQTTVGASLAEALQGQLGGRDLVVGVNQRSSFLRVVSVPKVSRAEMSKLIAIKLPSLLPLGPGEFVAGFRLPADGRHAIVGAVKSDHLHRIYEEAKALNLKIQAVLPRVFASWLVARDHNLNDCAVVGQDAGSVTIDVIAGGELKHSRTIPLPETDEEFRDELERTFQIADVASLPVLVSGPSDLSGEVSDPKGLDERLGDVGAIEKLLFNLELPEVARAQGDKTHLAAKNRALVAALAATLLGIYVFGSAKVKANNLAKVADDELTAQSQAKKDQVVALHESKLIHDSLAVVDAAFHPAQKFGDVIQVLGTSSSPKSWFTGLTLERGKMVLIRGDAMDSKTVAQYVADLSRDPRFRQMKLVFANKATIGKKPVVQFAISGHVVGNFPLDTVPGKGRGA